MKRKLFTLAAGLSLVLCAAMLVGWPRSYRHYQFAYLRYGRSGVSVLFDSGRVRWCFVRYTYSWEGAGAHIAGDEADAANTVLSFLGDPLVDLPQTEFAATTGEGDLPGLRIPAPDGQFHPDFHYWQVTVPAWILVALASILPAVWVLRRVRQQPREGLCTTCKYDLRATSDRCPECGTVVPHTRRASA